MINKVELIGRLTKDVEKRTTNSGSTVAQISVVTSENYKDKSGEWQEQSEFHNVVLWNNQADFAEKHLAKGVLVRIEGKLKTDEYEKDGQKRWSTKIIARDIKRLVWDKKGSNQQVSNQDQKDEFKHDDIPF